MLNATMRSFCSRLCQSRTFRVTMLVALALTSFVLCNRTVKVAAQDDGQTVTYIGRTLIARDANGTEEYAGPGTTIHFDSKGVPDLVGFSLLNAQGDRVWEGKYDIDATGQPENSGRLIIQGEAMNYVVEGLKSNEDHTYTYHLSYLELTTVKDKDAPGGYRAFAIKAIASDNKVDSLGEGMLTYDLPVGRQLVTVNGEIKFADSLIIPNYNLSGIDARVQALYHSRRTP